MQRFRRPHPPLPCWCGAGPAGRAHAYWECPVAQAVRATVASDEQADELQHLQPAQRTAATRAQLRAACTAAVNSFWGRLHDFSTLHPSPPERWPSLPPGQRLLTLATGRLVAGPGPPPDTVATLVEGIIDAHEAAAARGAGAT